MSATAKKMKEAEPAARAPPAGSGADAKQTWAPSEGMSLDELEQLGTNFVRASEVPERFYAQVVNAEVRPDSTGRICVYLRLRLEDNSMTVMKYTPLHIRELVLALKKLGFKNLGEVVGTVLQFEKKAFRIGYPRAIPIKVVGGGKE